jgi:hypothetical protein
MFKHRLIRTVAIALALGAVAASAAAARPIDLPSLPRDVQNADTRDTPAHSGFYRPMRPENQPQPPRDLRNPDTVDFANGRGPDKSPAVVVVDLPKPAGAPVSAGGIDWADAGLGAGSVLGVALLGLGGALFIVHRRGTRRLAT